MRVVAGQYRGRKLVAPPGETTRPTSDRVREALFSSLASMLGPDLGGVAALDAFAGSGALGLEAISRGASSATFVERDRRALASLRANVDALDVGRDVRVLAGDAFVLGKRGALPGGPFALLLLDPPYRLALSEVVGLVVTLSHHDLLEDGATVVLEHAAGNMPQWPEGFDLQARKRYGSTEVDIAVYRGEPGSS